MVNYWKFKIVCIASLVLLGTANAWANDISECEKLFKAKLFNHALPICKQLAIQGNMGAQHILGFMYYDGGQGVQKDYIEAARWQRKAAEQGLADAQTSLGTMYMLGKGVKKDQSEAVQWWNKAAKHGYAEAQFFLGYTYRQNKNYAKAVRWWQVAADQGNAKSQYALGLLYSDGTGVKRSGEISAKWYYKAGLSYLKEKNWDEALRSAQKIRELSDKHHFTITNASLADKLLERIKWSKKHSTNLNVNVTARKIADVMASNLPMKMNQNMILDKAFSIRNTVIFVVALTYDKAYLMGIAKQNSISMSYLKAKENKLLKTNICSSKNSKIFVNQGGAIEYRLKFIDGSSYLKTRIDRCEPI